MTDILKEKIIIRAIKVYKNREEWADDYVQENYQDAIEYEYGNGSSNTTESTKTGLNKRIESDMILSSLLGRPLMRCM